MLRSVLFLIFLMISGCSSPWYIGEWNVSDAKFPGISAMGMEEAKEWFGSKAVYAESSVTFRGETCAAPQFKIESLTEADFLNAYRATFASLGIEGELVEILSIDCPSGWPHPGATLIRANADMGYIPWDGVFFRLDRNAS